MMMAPGLRRLTFTTHVTASVGWIGAVLVFLALAVIAMTSQDEQTVRGAYLVMAPAGWFVLVPLAHASLLSGIALSLGTAWGLFRHYWVVLKLLITAFATVILLIYMGTFRQMAGVAADPVVNLEVVRNASPMSANSPGASIIWSFCAQVWARSSDRPSAIGWLPFVGTRPGSSWRRASTSVKGSTTHGSTHCS